MRPSYLVVVFTILLAAVLGGFAQDRHPGLTFSNGTGVAHIGTKAFFKCEMNAQFPRPFIDVVCLAALDQHMGWLMPEANNNPFIHCELMPDPLFMLTFFHGMQGIFLQWGVCMPISLDPKKYGYYNYFTNRITIPNDRALIGTKFVIQAFAVDPYPSRHYPTMLYAYASTVPQVITIKE